MPDPAQKQAIRMIVAQLTPEGMDDLQMAIKHDIMSQLQSVMSAEEAYGIKYRLDACDEFFLKINQIAESTPVRVDV